MFFLLQTENVHREHQQLKLERCVYTMSPTIFCHFVAFAVYNFVTAISYITIFSELTLLHHSVASASTRTISTPNYKAQRRDVTF